MPNIGNKLKESDPLDSWDLDEDEPATTPEDDVSIYGFI